MTARAAEIPIGFFCLILKPVLDEFLAYMAVNCGAGAPLFLKGNPAMLSTRSRLVPSSPALLPFRSRQR